MLKYACTRVGPMVRNLASSFVLRRHVSGPALLLRSDTRGSRRRHVLIIVVRIVIIAVAVVVVIVVVVMSVAGEAALRRDARALPVDR